MPLISGTAANDTLTGGTGSDSLDGGHGSDTLWGGAGTDTLVGDQGTGADNYLFAPMQNALLSDFGVGTGWTSQNINPRTMADVNGDGRADIVGFGTNAVVVSLGQADATFAPSQNAAVGLYGYGNGWPNQNLYPRTVGDVNGDGRDDIVAFASAGVIVSLGQSNGTFAASLTALSGYYGYSNGWSSQDAYPRMVADVNGDSRDDVVAFASGGVTVSLGQSNGTFATPITALSGAYGYNNTWTSQNINPRALADVNGDGRADIVGFGTHSVSVSLGQANGTFAAPQTALLNEFGYGNTWQSQEINPRTMADVNGDGRADIVGFGTNAVVVAYGLADGTFSVPLNGILAAYGYNSGWASQDATPRTVADVDGDGRADIVGFGTGAVVVSRSVPNGDLLYGEAGDDVLTGGAGPDTLLGGTGNDTYMVADGEDTIVENASEGTDEVRTALAAYTLPANVENLTYTGASAFAGTGNAGNNRLIGGPGTDTLAGGVGNDTYEVQTAADVVVEAAGEGTDEVRTALTAYTLGANVENLTYIGTGPAALTGNGANNLLVAGTGADTLIGDAGNDTLSGGAGADVMIGGLGNDVYQVDDIGDMVMENTGEGSDRVRSSITYTLGATLENLTLTGSAVIDGFGNAANNSMTGNSAANRLEGYAGNDTLNGGGGGDTLVGGTGNDLYSVDNAGDVLVELAGEGTDTVSSAITWTLAAEFEHLTLTGGAAVNGTGTAGANILIGNAAANRLQGLDGNDTLSGAAGDDTLEGGAGDDLYIVDSSADVVTELAGEGVDAVQSTASHILSSEVERLTLTGSAAIDGTGNAQANTLTGNGAANVLDGGAGADTLAGGGGDDTYVVDDAGDVVTEAAGSGSDTVRSTVTHVLAADVENLVLDGGGSIDGTGNGLDNLLTGNAAGNTLSGAAGTDTLDGGAGADTLIGGLGDDTYLVDDAGDTVVEAAGGDTDTVRTVLTYALGAEVEGLVLEGTAAVDGTGNGLANTITGNGADNVLNGRAGADTLSGGAGSDLFVIAAPAEGGDTVTDFTAGEDRIAVVGPNFGSVPAGALSASNFTLDAAADGDDWFVFNTTTGVLSFDADGSGAGAAVTLATLNVTMLSATDILVLPS